MLYHTGGDSVDIYNQTESTLAVLPPTQANNILTLNQISPGILVPRWNDISTLLNQDVISVTGTSTNNVLFVSNNVYDVSTNLFTTWTNLEPFIVNSASGDFVQVINGTFNLNNGSYIPSTNVFIDATLNVGWFAQANSHIGHRAIRFFNVATSQQIGATYQRADPSTSDTFTLELNRQFKLTPSDNLIIQVAADAIDVNVYMPLTHFDLHTVSTLP